MYAKESVQVAVGLQENHLLRADLHLALVLEPHILVSVGESLPINFDHILLAQAPDFPPLHLEVEQNDHVLPGDRTVG